MNTISIKEYFEARIESLWQNPKYDSVDIKKYGYSQKDNQTTNSLLFIGIKPSNSKKILYTILVFLRKRFPRI